MLEKNHVKISFQFNWLNLKNENKKNLFQNIRNSTNLITPKKEIDNYY